MNDDNQIGRLIKVSMAFLDDFHQSHSKKEILKLFPKDWDLERCNFFLDNLLDYCSQPENEFWEQAAVIKNVKEKINS